MFTHLQCEAHFNRYHHMQTPQHLNPQTASSVCPTGNILVCFWGIKRLRFPHEPKTNSKVKEKLIGPLIRYTWHKHALEAKPTIRANHVSTYLRRDGNLSVPPPWARLAGRSWPAIVIRAPGEECKDTLTQSLTTRKAFTCGPGWLMALEGAEAESIIRTEYVIYSVVLISITEDENFTGGVRRQ